MIQVPIVHNIAMPGPSPSGHPMSRVTKLLRTPCAGIQNLMGLHKDSCGIHMGHIFKGGVWRFMIGVYPDFQQLTGGKGQKLVTGIRSSASRLVEVAWT